MLKFKRIVSAIVLVAFLFNTAVFDTAFAQDKLGTPSRSGNLGDIESKDIVHIEAWFLMCLRKLPDRNPATILASLKELDDKQDVKLPYRSIFQPEGARFLIREAEQEGGIIKLRVILEDSKLRKGVQTPPRQYYIEYNTRNGGVEAYPKDKGKTRTPKAIKSAKRYAEHEEAIDRPIAEIIKRQEFAEVEGRAEALGHDKFAGRISPKEKAYVSRKTFGSIAARMDECLKLFGMTSEKALAGKNIVFLGVPDDAEDKSFPLIEAEDFLGRKAMVRVRSHASNNAVYVFLQSALYEGLLRDDWEALQKSAIENVAAHLIHEIGVIYGLPIISVEEEATWNELDMISQAVHKGQSLDPKYQAGIKEAFGHGPVDLDTNLDTRDYAMAEAVEVTGDEKTRALRIYEARGGLTVNNPDNYLVMKDREGNITVVEKAGTRRSGWHITHDDWQAMEAEARHVAAGHATQAGTKTVVRRPSSVVREGEKTATTQPGHNPEDAWQLILSSERLQMKMLHNGGSFTIIDFLAEYENLKEKLGFSKIAPSRKALRRTLGKLLDEFEGTAGENLLVCHKFGRENRYFLTKKGKGLLSPAAEASERRNEAIAAVTDRFFLRGRDVVDLAENQIRSGLEGEESSFAMLPGWFGTPTGKEKGEFYALDAGGTNLRIVRVRLNGNGTYKILGVLSPESHPADQDPRFTDAHKRGNAKELFGFIAGHIYEFLESQKVAADKECVFGFTWSFPIEQTGPAAGIHKKWTKGWKTKGVVGKDVVALLNKALAREAKRRGGTKKVPKVTIAALCNDTVATLALGRYQDSRCKGGIIAGTGTNGALALPIELFPGFACGRGDMMVNTEWGGSVIFQRNKYDILVDEVFKREDPELFGKQLFEKAVSGKYVGELARFAILDLIEKGVLFTQDKAAALKAFGTFKTFLSEHGTVIEKDGSKKLAEVEGLLSGTFGITKSTPEDRETLKRLWFAIIHRAGRLIAYNAVAGTRLMNLKAGEETVYAIDGSLYEHHPEFIKAVEAGLKETSSMIKIDFTKDASSIGAAVMAASVAASAAKAVTPTPPDKGFSFSSSGYDVTFRILAPKTFGDKKNEIKAILKARIAAHKKEIGAMAVKESFDVDIGLDDPTIDTFKGCYLAFEKRQGSVWFGIYGRAHEKALLVEGELTPSAKTAAEDRVTADSLVKYAENFINRSPAIVGRNYRPYIDIFKRDLERLKDKTALNEALARVSNIRIIKRRDVSIEAQRTARETLRLLIKEHLDALDHARMMAGIGRRIANEGLSEAAVFKAFPKLVGAEDIVRAGAKAILRDKRMEALIEQDAVRVEYEDFVSKETQYMVTITVRDPSRKDSKGIVELVACRTSGRYKVIWYKSGDGRAASNVRGVYWVRNIERAAKEMLNEAMRKTQLGKWAEAAEKVANQATPRPTSRPSGAIEGPAIERHQMVPKLEAINQKIWLDGLTWDMITTGKFAYLVKRYGITGVTTNPTLINAYMESSDVKKWMERLAAEGIVKGTPKDILEKEIYRTVVTDLAKKVIAEFIKCEVKDCKFSVELEPANAENPDASVEEAKVWAAIDPEHMMIKVPVTKSGSGCEIIKRLTALGINVNATLIFTEDDALNVADAYIAGLVERDAQGLDISNIYSVMSFFISRWDVKVEGMASLTPEARAAMRGRLANAITAKAHRAFLKRFEEEDFQKLKAKGAKAQEFLEASTASKGADIVRSLIAKKLESHGFFEGKDEDAKKNLIENAFETRKKEPQFKAILDAYPATIYIRPLLGDGVNTLPDKSIIALADEYDTRPFEVVRMIEKTADGAQALIEEADKWIDRITMGKALLADAHAAFRKDFDKSFVKIREAIASVRTIPEVQDWLEYINVTGKAADTQGMSAISQGTTKVGQLETGIVVTLRIGEDSLAGVADRDLVKELEPAKQLAEYADRLSFTAMVTDVRNQVDTKRLVEALGSIRQNQEERKKRVYFLRLGNAMLAKMPTIDIAGVIRRHLAREGIDYIKVTVLPNDQINFTMDTSSGISVSVTVFKDKAGHLDFALSSLIDTYKHIRQDTPEISRPLQAAELARRFKVWQGSSPSDGDAAPRPTTSPSGAIEGATRKGLDGAVLKTVAQELYESIAKGHYPEVRDRAALILGELAPHGQEAGAVELIDALREVSTDVDNMTIADLDEIGKRFSLNDAEMDLLAFIITERRGMSAEALAPAVVAINEMFAGTHTEDASGNRVYVGPNVAERVEHALFMLRNSGEDAAALRAVLDWIDELDREGSLTAEKVREACAKNGLNYSERKLVELVTVPSETTQAAPRPTGRPSGAIEGATAGKADLLKVLRGFRDEIFPLTAPIFANHQHMSFETDTTWRDSLTIPDRFTLCLEAVNSTITAAETALLPEKVDVSAVVKRTIASLQTVSGNLAQEKFNDKSLEAQLLTIIRRQIEILKSMLSDDTTAQVAEQPAPRPDRSASGAIEGATGSARMTEEEAVQGEKNLAYIAALANDFYRAIESVIRRFATEQGINADRLNESFKQARLADGTKIDLDRLTALVNDVAGLAGGKANTNTVEAMDRAREEIYRRLEKSIAAGGMFAGIDITGRVKKLMDLVRAGSRVHLAEIERIVSSILTDILGRRLDTKFPVDVKLTYDKTRYEIPYPTWEDTLHGVDAYGNPILLANEGTKVVPIQNIKSMMVLGPVVTVIGSIVADVIVPLGGESEYPVPTDPRLVYQGDKAFRTPPKEATDGYLAALPEELRAKLTVTYGGPAFASAMVLHQLGARVKLIGAVGDDKLGQGLLAELRKRGMDTSGIKVIPGISTSTNLIFSNTETKTTSYNLALGSANEYLEEGDVSDEDLAAAVVHLGGIGLNPRLTARLAQLIKRAKAKGAKVGMDTVVDLYGAEKEQVANLGMLDYMTPSIKEASPVTECMDASDNMRFFADHGIPTVFLKDGENGSVVAVNGGAQIFAMPAVQAVKVVDTTGAGDSYSAYVALGIARGMTPRDTAKGATACGALTVQRRGGGSISDNNRPLEAFRAQMEILERELAGAILVIPAKKPTPKAAMAARAAAKTALARYTPAWYVAVAMKSLALSKFDRRTRFSAEEVADAYLFNFEANPWLGQLHLANVYPRTCARAALWALEKKGLVAVVNRTAAPRDRRYAMTDKGRRMLHGLRESLVAEIGEDECKTVIQFALDQRQNIAAARLARELREGRLTIEQMALLKDAYREMEILGPLKEASALTPDNPIAKLQKDIAAINELGKILHGMGLPQDADELEIPNIDRIGGVETLEKAMAAIAVPNPEGKQPGSHAAPPVEQVAPRPTGRPSGAIEGPAVEERVDDTAVNWLMRDLREGAAEKPHPYGQLIQGLNTLAGGNHIPTLEAVLKAMLVAPEVNAFFASADIYAKLHEEVVKRLAVRTGEMIMEKGGLPYLLLVPFEFYKGSEFKEDSDELGLNSRYHVERIGGSTLKEYVDAILTDKAKGREEKSVALIPGRLVTMTSGADLELKRLMDAKVRFIIADLNTYGRAMGKPSRRAFRANTYSIMHLVRFVNSDMKGTLPYATLSHYLKRHFQLPGGMAVDDYLKALAGKTREDVLTIIKGWLVPIEKEDADRDHVNLSRPLIFA